jgi:SP family sugar:H+ symporter-like MFS transporter
MVGMPVRIRKEELTRIAGTVFFTNLGTIGNPFLISLITTLVNVCSTPLAFWTIERFGRRTLILYGAAGMVVCQFIIAIVGTVDPGSQAATSTMIAFICTCARL